MHAVGRGLAFCLALLIAGCSTLGQHPSLSARRLTAAGFALSVLPASFQGQPPAGEFVLHLAPDPAGWRVDVEARRVEDLRSLYVELRYRASDLQIESARASGLLAAAAGTGRLLELAVLDEPGLAVHGQLLAPTAAAAGFSGDGVLTSFFFSPRPANAGDQPARGASLAPARDASATVLSLDLGNTELHWGYYNQGDYDQNSEVNVADLTPLGRHFLEAGPFLVNAIGAVVDGDGNGEINVADLTPIGANYGRRVRGYRIYESLDAGNYPAVNDAPSALAALGETSLSEGDPAQERLHYSFLLNEVVVGAFYWVRPYDGEPLDPAASLGTPSNMVSAGDPGNLPPAAVLAANPAFGLAPLQVRLSGADSADPDGAIVLYEFDFDNDGSYDLATAESFCEHIVTGAGEHIINLRVTDNRGATGVAGVDVVTDEPAGWDLFVPFPDLPLDFWIDNISEAVLVQGNPALALESDYDGLFFSRSLDQTGTLWAQPQPLDTDGLYSGAPALAIVGGAPALAFAGSEHNNLYFMRASSADGDAWLAPQQLAAQAGVYGPRLLVDGDGLPLSAFLSTAGAGWQINAVLGEDELGAAWSAIVEVESGDPGYSAPALKLIAGTAAAAYQDSEGNTVFAPASGDPAGSDWDRHVAFDPPPLNGLSLATPALLEVAGHPAVAFGFIGPGEPERLGFSRADDAAGTAWPAPALLDDGAELSCRPSLFSLDGVPAVAYCVQADGPWEELRLLRAADAEAAAWDDVEVIGEFPDVQQVYGIELDGGRAGLVLRSVADHDDDPRLISRAVYFAVEQ